MKFTSQSLKPDLKPQNEDFFFERETQRGHFFAVLDFDQHDFANLNTTLEAKLETIVDSFVPLSRFSADLFLGFIAKEINSFLYTLVQHDDEQETLCSAALCLVSDNRLSYFSCGDVQVTLINDDQMLRLGGFKVDEREQSIPQLGRAEDGTPFTDHIQHLTLKEGDVVLIMSSGLASEFDGPTLLDQVLSAGSLEPETICSTLMEESEASQEDRTLVVIVGSYERSAEVSFMDAHAPAAPVKHGLDSAIEAVDIAGGEAQPTNITVDEDRLLELEQKLENLSVVLANKADTVELLGLQSEVLKLGVMAKDNSDTETDPPRHLLPIGEVPEAITRRSSARPLMWITLLLLVGIAGGFIGGWINASRTARVTEAWTVKTSGNQIVISRLNSEASPSIVTINTVRPLQPTGEQTFSSFADVKHYIDTITPAEAPAKAEQVEPEPEVVSQSPPKPLPSAPAKQAKPADIVTSIAFRQGDSLKTLAERYRVPPARLIALNPKITRWSVVKAGQRVVVPAGPGSTRNVSRQPEQSASQRPSKTATKRVTVEAGDTLNKLANRHNLSPTRLKELNPQITNWSRLQSGQKVLVPTPVRG